jgi:hypothetical protein
VGGSDALCDDATMNAAVEPDFEVAISFLRADEALARQLADALAPARVFVYSRQQEQLAGNNGIEEFRSAFLTRSHIAVVLHRRGWGETPYTTVESIAIQERGLQTAWLKLVFVTQDDAPLPAWLPHMWIRFDLRAYPIDQLVGAIRQKLADAGIAVRPVTASERAAQTARREAFDADTSAMLNASPEPFCAATATLHGELERQISEICAQTGWDVVRGKNRTEFVAFMGGVTMQLLAQELYANTARDASILLRYFNGRLLTPDERVQGKYMTYGPDHAESETTITLGRDPAMGWFWRWDSHRVVDEEAARILLTELLDRRDKARKKK